MALAVIPVPCLKDNYAYLVTRGAGPECVVVDACEAEPIDRVIAERGLRLCGILSTHHHADHVGGNLALAADAQLPIWGHASELSRIPGLSRPLEHGDVFEVAGLRVSAWHIPAHTRGALAYRIGDRCFTGDTAFTGGAGRLFEGTAHELYKALYEVLGRLPESTTLCTGHEYTEANLRFALTIEPGNEALRERYAHVRAQRSAGEVTAMATLALERATNPFFRVDQPSVVAGLGLSPGTDGPSAMAHLRQKKNEWTG